MYALNTQPLWNTEDN